MEMYEEEQTNKREVRGITDKVTKDAKVDVQYPVINVMLTGGTPKYKLQALARLLKSSVKSDDEEVVLQDNSVHVALKAEGVYKPIGRVMPQQIKTLMSILVGIELELEMEKGNIMDKKYIYALSS